MAFLLVSAKAQNSEKGSVISIVPSFNLGSAAGKSNNIKTETNSRLGIGLGIEYLQMLSKKVFLTGMVGINSRGYSGGAKVRATYIDVPVLINAALGKRGYWTIGAGAYAGMALSGKYKTNNGWTSMKFGEGTTDNRSRTDAGYAIQFGVLSPFFGRAYVLFYGGVKNVIPGDRQTGGNELHLRTVSFNLAIPIKVKRK